jgi:Peptidase propeptide and YPEB domain
MRLERTLIVFCLTALVILGSPQAGATGFATCDSGPREKWQPQEKLASLLKDKGWQIRRIRAGRRRLKKRAPRGALLRDWRARQDLNPRPLGS